MAASIADTLIQGAQQQNQAQPLNITGSITAGAQLAQQAEKNQVAQQELQQKQQQLFVTKLEKVAGWYETAAKMEDGKQKNVFTDQFITQGISALGLDKVINPTAKKTLDSNPDLAAYLVNEVRQNKITVNDAMTAANDPEALARIAPLVKQFKDAQGMPPSGASIAEAYQNEQGKFQKASESNIEDQRKLKEAQMNSVNNAARANAFQQTADVRVTQAGQAAIDKVNNDHNLTPMFQQSQSVFKGQNILNRPSPSWKAVNEVLQDYSSALNPKGGGTDFKLKEFSTPTASKWLANLQEGISSNPDQPAPQAMVDWLKQFGDNLESSFDANIAGRANTLSHEADVTYKKFPDIAQAVKDQAKFIERGAWKGDMQKVNIFGQKMTAAQAKAFIQQHPNFSDQIDPATKKDLGL